MLGCPPDDSDIDAWLGETFAVWRDKNVLAPSAARARDWRFYRDQKVEELSDGGLHIRFSADGIREPAERLFTWGDELMIEKPAVLVKTMRERITSSQGSIINLFETPLGNLHPLRLSPTQRGIMQLCLAYLVSRPMFADQAVRPRLYDDLLAIVGPLTVKTLNGYPGFDARRLNDPATATSLVDYTKGLLSSAREEA